MSVHDFKAGEKLIYKGTGFIGFSKDDTEMEFISYYAVTDAWVYYKGEKLVVSKYELERPKKSANDRN